MKDKLAESEIEERLRHVPQWRRSGDAIERTFDCRDFNGSIAFVNAVALAANAANHHPDIRLAWNEVALSLSSHDAGGLTERDFALAATIDASRGA